MKTDFILDFETIGQNSRKVPAIDCAYTTFVWERFLDQPYSFSELVSSIKKSKLSIKDQVSNYDFVYAQSDLNFWMEQPPEIRKNLKPTPNDLTANQFVETLIDYLRQSDKISHWWSRSNTFDPIILDHLACAVKREALVNEYLQHWKVRDTRTWIDAKLVFPAKNGFVPVANEELWNKTFKLHDSAHDVAADILRLQAIHRAENDMEQVEI